MGKKQRTTVVVQSAGSAHKICKIWFGSDGSYYVTAPYHTANKAILTKATLNYAAGPLQEIPVSDMLEVAALDEGRLKLSHHPDGFCQFSGDGIRSGRDENGRPKGIGIFARDLMHVTCGPTFAVLFCGLQNFAKCEQVPATDVLFDVDRIADIPEANGYRIEGYYLRPEFRRFVEIVEDGTQWISIIHPTSAILRLRAILAPVASPLPGLIGSHISRSPFGPADSGYSITGPGGNLRDNSRGENIGEMITAMYPRPEEMPTRRDVGFQSEREEPAQS